MISTAPPTAELAASDSSAPDRVDGEVCYLLVFPCAPTDLPRASERIHRLKDAPYFDAIDIDIRTVARQAMDAIGVDVAIRQQVYDGVIQLAECVFALPDALSPQALQTKAHVQAALRTRLTAGVPADTRDLVEEYTTLSLRRVARSPDEFVDRNAQALARFIRSQREVFSRHDLDEILVSRVRYSERELTVVDWEGAIVIAPDGDQQSDIELLKVGNYQLLRYRLLDRAIEGSLQTIRQHFREGARPSWLPNRSKRVLRQAIEQRLALMLGFEKIDQSLLLIGDWYTAKLYHLIYGEFYLDDWTAAIKSKLESLESISQIVQDNFTFSWSRFLEILQIAGWLVLLVGYFVLFYLDVSVR